MEKGKKSNGMSSEKKKVNFHEFQAQHRSHNPRKEQPLLDSQINRRDALKFLPLNSQNSLYGGLSKSAPPPPSPPPPPPATAPPPNARRKSNAGIKNGEKESKDESINALKISKCIMNQSEAQLSKEVEKLRELDRALLDQRESEIKKLKSMIAYGEKERERLLIDHIKLLTENHILEKERDREPSIRENDRKNSPVKHEVFDQLRKSEEERDALLKYTMDLEQNYRKIYLQNILRKFLFPQVINTSLLLQKYFTTWYQQKNTLSTSLPPPSQLKHCDPEVTRAMYTISSNPKAVYPFNKHIFKRLMSPTDNNFDVKTTEEYFLPIDDIVLDPLDTTYHLDCKNE